MESRVVVFKGDDIIVHKYEYADLPEILKPFIIWYLSAYLSDDYGLRMPSVPEEFTEKFTSFVLGYFHKDNDGPDAFEIDGEEAVPVEIKSTTTYAGFQGAITPENFQKLVWFDFPLWKELKFSIYEYPKEIFVYQKKRFSLRKIARENNIPVKCTGSLLLTPEDFNLNEVRYITSRNVSNVENIIKQGRSLVYIA